MSDPILQVDELSMAFGGVQALRGVSLEVRRGEIFSVIGPNGQPPAGPPPSFL